MLALIGESPDLSLAEICHRLEAGCLIFIDETWDTTKMHRSHGRCRGGERLNERAPGGRWYPSTFVTGLRQDAIVEPPIFNRPMNNDIFPHYVTQHPGADATARISNP